MNDGLFLMKILITGASGFLGKRLLRTLSSQDVKITVAHRNELNEIDVPQYIVGEL